MDVLVYGAGAVGMGLASALRAAGGSVRIVARPETAAALRASGLLRTGVFGEHRAAAGSFEVAERLGDLAQHPADATLVTVKSFDSEAAAADLSTSPIASRGVVLCQNGWGNAERFVPHFGEDRVWNARVITGFTRPEPHHVHVTVHAEPVHMGSLFGRDPAPLSPLCEAIARGGLPCETTPHVGRDLFAKLLYNGTLNPLGAICGVAYGELGRSAHTRGLIAEVAREIFAVMTAAGHDTHWPTAEAWLADLHERLLPPTAAHESSMLQDLRAGRPTEIDALLGEVVRLGQALGLQAPTCAALEAIVRFLEERGSAKLSENRHTRGTPASPV